MYRFCGLGLVLVGLYLIGDDFSVDVNDFDMVFLSDIFFSGGMNIDVWKGLFFL